VGETSASETPGRPPRPCARRHVHVCADVAHSSSDRPAASSDPGRGRRDRRGPAARRFCPPLSNDDGQRAGPQPSQVPVGARPCPAVPGGDRSPLESDDRGSDRRLQPPASDGRPAWCWRPTRATGRCTAPSAGPCGAAGTRGRRRPSRSSVGRRTGAGSARPVLPDPVSTQLAPV
jgi:hypothetical protein